MADLSITVANVALVAGQQSSIQPVSANQLAGATITAGQPVYLSAASTWLLARADTTALASGVGTTWGIALHGALTGQPVAVLTAGQITIGATVALGTQYVLSASGTAGKIAPYSDLTTTNLVSVIGVAISTTVIAFAPNATGIAHA